MKLILAIIQDEDAHEVITALNDAKFQVTRLNTKGGFLRAGNTTLMTGVPAEKVDEALKIIEENSIHSIFEKDRLGPVHKAVFRILCISKEA